MSKYRTIFLFFHAILVGICSGGATSASSEALHSLAFLSALVILFFSVILDLRRIEMTRGLPDPS